MRAPKRRRPRRDQRWQAGGPAELAVLSSKVSYIISPEHKDYLTAAGPAKLRSDATPCPRGLKLGDVETWLKEAVAKGDISADCSGEFPRYAWVRIDGRVYEARLSNAGLGQYKGYPVHSYEAPAWLT